jgi:photosystem II stability/assembly factor-like uncharacterized protein
MNLKTDPSNSSKTRQTYPLLNPNQPIIRVMRSFCLIVLASLSLATSAQIKPTSAADRLKTFDQRKLLQARSMVNNIPFRNIGPTIMSGRVVDLDVNPDDPTEFYVAYASGGLWYTKNNGQSFEPIFDSEDILVIGDIAINWASGKNSPSNRIIWIGTGEVNSSRSSYAGIGIYKSTNNGKTWQYLGLPESQHIGKIQLHPTDKNTAWVAVLGHLYSPNKERGLYKTIDGGNSWKQTLAIDDNTGVVDIDINPSNPQELYATAWYRTRSSWNFEEGGKSSGIYKSIDGGETWKLLTTEGKGFPTGTGVGRIGVAVYEKNPSIVYAVVDNNFRKPDTATKKKDTSKYVLSDFEKLNAIEFLKLDDKKLDTFLRKNGLPEKYTAMTVKELVKQEKIKPSALHDYLFDANTALFETPIIGCEVYRSDNGGEDWKKVNEKEINIYNTYGYYFGKIYVSPYNENKVFIQGFYTQLSTDGGKTFKTIDKPNVHPDHHALWIDPKRDSHIIDGNDGGANISYDDGEAWFKANTPAVGQFYSVAVDDAKPYNVYGGLQDNGVWFGPSTNKEDPGWINDGAYPFTAINGGDGMQVQVDTRDNKTVYSGFQFGFYNRQTVGGANPKSIKPYSELGEPKLRFNWQTPIALSRHNQDVIYLGSNRFYRSLNRGDSMVAMGPDLTSGGKSGDVPFGTLTTISESPLRFELLYAGADDGNLHVSKDGGNTWTNISKKLPQGLWVSRVLASQYKEGRVYVTLNGYRNDHFLPYLFVSEDYGNTWKQIGKDLPFEPLNVVKEDPVSEQLLYVGSDGGLYVSVDSGNSFMMWNKGLPRSVPVHDIAIHTGANEIVLGTHGRSLYIAKLDSVQLLIKDSEYRGKKQMETDRMISVMQGTAGRDLFKREGIEVECPPVNYKKLNTKKNQKGKQ